MEKRKDRNELRIFVIGLFSGLFLASLIFVKVESNWLMLITSSITMIIVACYMLETTSKKLSLPVSELYFPNFGKILWNINLALFILGLCILVLISLKISLFSKHLLYLVIRAIILMTVFKKVVEEVIE